MKQRTHRRGQAIVEFALSATLIFFLLCATIDLGLIFFAVQGMHNAAQEGGTYGSRWLITDATGKRVLNAELIRKKVRFESGEQGGIGFVNLLDLNGDGIDDLNQSGVLEKYISVQMLSDSPDFDGDPLNNGTAPDYSPCVNAATANAGGCYAYITVRANHKIVFPLAPVFTDTVQLRSSFMVPIRDTFNQGDPSAPPPVITTPGPTPNADSIVITYAGSAAENSTITQQSQAVFGFNAYDSNVGTTNGDGIDNVSITVVSSNGTINYTKPDFNPAYCPYGNGGCASMSNNHWNSLPANVTAATPSPPTQLTITATATGKNGGSKSITVTVYVNKS